jgi:hypothetical protein
MTRHRFKVGDLVRVRATVSRERGEGFLDVISHRHIEGTYEVTRLMPELPSGEPQYRIKSTDDQTERVVREGQLVAVAGPQVRR